MSELHHVFSTSAKALASIFTMGFVNSVQKILLFSLVFHSATIQAALPCSTDYFQKILPSDATALSALSLGPNSTFGEPTSPAYPANSTALPALCILTVNVTTSATSSYRFGLFLPEDWNGRFATVGNGGLAGAINWPSMGSIVKYGFAVASTDTGHNSSFFNAEWALNNNEKITDAAYRAIHGTVVHSKAVVKAHYSHNISYSYYWGCSTGGRQGFLELQRYPEDFDGILAGAPAWEATKYASWGLQMQMMNLPATAENHIPPSLFPLVQAEAIRQCDSIDGVEDGIISDPQACPFRPETLLCAPGKNSSGCLTSPQINTLNLLYGRYFNTDKPMFYFPLSPGSEVGWAGILTEPDTSYLRYIQLQDPNWDWHSFNYSLVEYLDATSDRSPVPEQYDITPFAKRGGKLIHYHGLADFTIPWQSSRFLYESTYRNVTSKGTNVDDFYRLFYVPGMLHCSGAVGDAPWFFGGGDAASLGPDVYGVPGFRDSEHDAVLALMKWVEEDVAPQWLVATKYVNDTVDLGVRRQRKICPYPGKAKFTGGDADSAESWTC